MGNTRRTEPTECAVSDSPHLYSRCEAGSKSSGEPTDRAKKLETELKIEIARPPNFEQILAAFPGASGPGVIFAYGDTIYNPSNIVIPPALVAHEEVHGRRQSPAGEVLWWDRYISDPEFRYNEELHAHAAELKTLQHIVKDRNTRVKLAMTTAQRLLAPLYNYGVPKSLNQAICDLRYVMEHK